jgi:hypothetical protein
MLFVIFRNKHIFYGEDVSPTPNLQAGGPLLFGCPKLLIQYIRSYPSISAGRLPHPQHEDVPCSGDKGPTLHRLLIYPCFKTDVVIN